MKRNHLFTIVPTLLLMSGAIWMGQGLLQAPSESHYVPRSAVQPGYTGGNLALDYYNLLRLNTRTGNVEAADRQRALMETKELIRAQGGNRAIGLQWIEHGPDNVGGRTRGICVDRNNPNIVWAGSVSGGLFKSMDYGNNWIPVTTFDQIYSIADIVQSYDGTIWVATGSSFESTLSSNWGNSGGQGGDGLYYSTDGGATWSLINGTTSLSFSHLAADPNNPADIYVGASNGLKKATVGGSGLTATPVSGTSCKDVDVTKDGQVIVAVVGSKPYVSTDAGATFLDMSSAANTSNPTALFSTRSEIAISYDKNNQGKYNVLIATSTSSSFKAYFSNDNGSNFYLVAPISQSFNPVSSQGSYNLTCTHVPGYPGRFLVGGVDNYEFVQNVSAPTTGQWYQRTFWFYQSPNPQYVHADNHEMTWDYSTNQLYIGDDGGIFKSADRSFNVFYAANRGYNVTQFYSVAFSGTNEVVGGAQDNGTQFIDHAGANWLSAVEVKGGDGFDCDMSQLAPDVMFASVYFGDVERNNGGTFSSFYTASMADGATRGTPGDLSNGLGGFHTTFRYSENENDMMSTDTVVWVVPQDSVYFNGETIHVNSRNLGLKFDHVLTAADVAPGDSLVYGDTLWLPDRIQTIFAISLNNGSSTSTKEYGLWITRGAGNFTTTPVWDSFPNAYPSNDLATCIEFSTDGYTLYYGTANGEVFKMTGLQYYYGGTGGYMRDSIQITQIYAGSQIVTGIAVDPQDPDHIVVTYGNYGQSSNIKECNNTAAATPVFTSIKGNMPTMPVYDAVIDRLDPNKIIAGTEMGIYSSSNGGASWTWESTGVTGYGMGIVPVYAVRQQWRPWSDYTKNPGVIYVGTHGRGIWSSETLLSSKPIEPGSGGKNDLPGTMLIYPNPSVNQAWAEVNLKSDTKNGTMYIFTLEGRMVSQTNTGRLSRGSNRVEIPVNALASGTYIVKIAAGDVSFVGRAIVSK